MEAHNPTTIRRSDGNQMHENLRLASTALSRSINSQAKHWMRVGMLNAGVRSCYLPPAGNRLENT